MSKNSQIQALCLRYVLPFYYKQSFEKAVSLVNEQESGGIWEKVYVDSETQESDLFDYIREEFLFEKGQASVPGERGGATWRHKKTDRILELLYFENPITKKDTVLPEYINISVSDMGLILYKNHLGLLWYELALPYRSINADQLILFQNRIKELNRAYGGIYVWERCMSEPEYGIAIPKDAACTGDVPTDANVDYIVPFAFGKWLKQQIGFLDSASDKKAGGIWFFAERKSAYASAVFNGMESAKGLNCLKKSLPCKEEETNEEYKKRIKNRIDPEPEAVPDKALLFSYCLIDLEECAMPAFSFRMGNGYKPSYLISTEALQDVRRPFANAYWFASQEGTAYCAMYVPENAQTFKDDIYNKAKTDYFTLYLKVLYQSFSLLIFAERIQKEVPASMAGADESSFTEPITKLLGEISLFLTKSMATSVSHVHHQSEFYNYLKQRLRVKADVESVTAGMNALEVLMREQAENAEKQRDYRMQAILAMFALLGIFSALADCKGFFDNFAAFHGVYLLCLLVIAGISLITLFYVRDVFKMIKNDFMKIFAPLVKKIFRKQG